MAAIEAEVSRTAADAEQPVGLRERLAGWGRFMLSAFAVAVTVGALQSVAFYRTFTPQVEQANRLLFDLVVESSGHELYERIAGQVRELEDGGGDQYSSIGDAWNTFHEQFSTAPVAAIAGLRGELEALASAGAPDPVVTRLLADLRRFEAIHVDRYELLLEGLDDPPFWLWPTARLLVRYSDAGGAMTLNRALHLAQVGEVGTARVLLTGLRASTEDPRMLGLIYYALGRLEFELFRARPDAELYTQSVQYVRQSLRSDPGLELAKRFLDYLLSLSQAEAVPRAGEGKPTTPSEGEGAAISADKRRF
jgi:hypothetical protein